MSTLKRFSVYLISISVASILSGIGTYFLNYKFDNLLMISGIVFVVIGISMNSRNSYREFGGSAGNSIVEYDTFVELRAEKERAGNYDYTDRAHGFSIGMKLLFSGMIILALGVVLSYALHYLS